jgi:myo-inositol 2-dehydrogenase / D-chiro-inositol 1-dehydrogenase
MIRLALIGCGEHSESGHAVPLARYKALHTDEIELAAACDPMVERAEAFCRKHGFLKSYADVDELLSREKLDGCIAVVPVGSISQIGIKLLGLGIPCVVEKPLGASLAEARALLEVARETQTPNLVSVNRRFMPFLNGALTWSRAIGPLRYVRCTLTRSARREREFLWTTAIHAVDALRYIAGEVIEANIRTLRGASESAEWYAIDLRFEGGAAGHIDVLPTAGMMEETYELFGEGFRATATCPFGPELGWSGFRENCLVTKELASESGAEDEVPEKGMSEDVLNGCFDETAEFVRALTSNHKPRPSIEEVFPSVELCLSPAAAANETSNRIPVKI